ncbi:hypothetical protein [Hyphomicrobium sp.]|uniref:hypothetical protein n=1 Tax=Hyphomicrobium sp. TaxID=82 RepID=UPI003F6E7DFF
MIAISTYRRSPMRHLAQTLCLSISIALAAPAHACWEAPQPRTIEEMAHVAENQGKRSSQKLATRAGPGLLALSDGHLRTAYGAGVLVGWGETGKRPEFSTVTAVGLSALVAPLAFLGEEQDRKIADIFSCSAGSVQDMAERAAGYLDPATLEKIARKHEAGGRLLVSLPGSAARRESVWDLGAIAASRHPQAQPSIRSILLAAADLTTAIDPATVPNASGMLTERNPTFREIGAGERFLAVQNIQRPHAAAYLIHNGVLFPDEGETYMASRNGAVSLLPSLRETPLVVPAYDFFAVAQDGGTAVRIASPRPHLSIQPASEFDPSFIRALFTDAYRQARMGREWRRTFPDRERTYGP